MIISRYINREVYFGMVAITAVLLLIFISNQFVRYLGDAAIGRMTAQSVLQMMAIQVPLLSGFMVPLGYYLALLLGYGRLHADSEMLVMFGCGVSRARLMTMTLRGAATVSLVVAVLMLWVYPKMSWYRDHILASAAAASPLQKMVPGRFQVIAGKYVFYAEELSRDHQKMNKIFAAEVPAPDAKPGPRAWSVMSAESAQQKIDVKTGEQYLEFSDGTRYIGAPGSAEYQIAQYATYGMKIPTRAIHMSRLEEFLPSIALWHEYHINRVAAAELQWRISMPLSVLILALIGVPLSQVQPRQGRYARLFPAVMIYIVYIDLLFVSQSWVQKGIVSPRIGMWWVHGLMLMFAGVLASVYLGWWQRWSGPNRQLKQAVA